MKTVHVAIAGILLLAASACNGSSTSLPDTRNGVTLNAADLKCIGTEPFWSLALSRGAFGYHDSADYLDMEGTARTFTLERPYNDAKGTLSVSGHNDADESAVHLTLERTGQCSDGMSDIVFEYALEIVQQGHPSLRGCCSQQD